MKVIVQKKSICNLLIYSMVILSFISYEHLLYIMAYQKILAIVFMLGLLVLFIGLSEKKIWIKFYKNINNNILIHILSLLLLISTLITSIKFQYISFSGFVKILSIIGSFYIFYLFIPILFEDMNKKTNYLTGLISIFSIIAILIGIKGSFLGYTPTTPTRIASIFFDPNYFGTLCSIGFILSVHKTSIYRLFALINLIALVYSGSRGAMFSLFMVMIIFYFYNKKINIKSIVIFIIFVLIAICFLLFLQSIGFFRIYQGLSGRESLWFIGYELIKQEPLWGYGFGSLGELLGAKGLSNGSTHNAYLDYIIAFGLIPFMFYGLVIIKAVYLGYKKKVDPVIIKTIFFLLINANLISINLGGIGATSLLLTFFLGYCNLIKFKESNLSNNLTLKSS